MSSVEEVFDHPKIKCGTRKPVRKELSDYLVGSLIFIGFVYFLNS